MEPNEQVAPEEQPRGIDQVLEDLATQEQGAPASAEPSGAETAPETGVAVVEGVESVKPPDEPEAPPVLEGQPRDEQGRFLPKEETAPEGEIEPEITADLPELEGEWEEIIFPGDEPDEPAIQAPPEIAAKINELAEKAQRADAIIQEAEAGREAVQDAVVRQAELDEIEDYIAADPAGYISQKVRPELRQQIVMDLLLSDDAIYDHVAEVLDQWQNEPHERRIQSAEHRATRVEREAQFQQTRESRKRNQRQASEIMSVMKGYVPTEMDPETARRFADDMYRDLTDYGQKNGFGSVSAETLPTILAYRFSQYGVDPNRMNGASRDESGVVVAQPANKEAQAIADARQTGEKLRIQYQNRRAAGASAPVGAGTPVNRARPPKGANLDEALDWAKQNIGSG